MKSQIVYLVTVLSVLFELAVSDYASQYYNGYPSVRNSGYGYPNPNGVEYGYNNGYGSGYGYSTNQRYHDSQSYHQDPYAQSLWPNAAPLPYQQFPKPNEKYYDNLASRKHDRSLLENLNNLPVAKH
ncbi:hypothetical protein FQR65_LT08784 [Abscondita terminalis]|nr:hypothetical protein FQR65_LT08784 [Abscondita terminalis]